MTGRDTSLGGSANAFPSTAWSLISRLGHPSPEDQRKAMEELCRNYWKPVYYFIRIGRARSNEDAKDLAQAFFAWLVQGDAITRYAPEKGGFRTFLKVLLKRFVKDQTVSANSLKRGGGTHVVPLDDGETHLAEVLADSRTADPEQVFDEEWLSTLSRHAIDRLRGRLQSEGRDTQFKIFEAHDLTESDPKPSYGELASTFGVKEGAIRDTLHTVRGLLREELRTEVARLTSNREELEEEWNALFGS